MYVIFNNIHIYSVINNYIHELLNNVFRYANNKWINNWSEAKWFLRQNKRIEG